MKTLLGYFHVSSVEPFSGIGDSSLFVPGYLSPKKMHDMLMEQLGKIEVGSYLVYSDGTLEKRSEP